MRHLRLASCGSTNDEARRAFDEGAALPLLITAERQTTGRGRQGRHWAQLPGNLAASYLIEATRTLRRTPGILSLLAALAVRDGLRSFGADGETLRLKWPNDLLLDEQKVAGILSEYLEDNRRRAFIVGIGVNLAAAPAEGETIFPARAVFGPRAPSPCVFAERLGDTLLRHVARAEAVGPGWVLEAWKASAWRLGEPLAVRFGEGTAEGVFTDLSEEGHMILRLPEGVCRTIAAGDIVLR